jgi:hypothetical protein
MKYNSEDCIKDIGYVLNEAPKLILENNNLLIEVFGKLVDTTIELANLKEAIKTATNLDELKKTTG